MSTINDNNYDWQVMVLFLKNIAESKGLSQNDIAKRTGLKQSNISRLFGLRYCPTLKTFIMIAKALEVNFFFEDRNSTSELNVLFEAAMTELGRRPGYLPKN